MVNGARLQSPAVAGALLHRTLTVAAPVNESGVPPLTREQVWDGLQRLARADPMLIPPEAHAEVVDDTGREFVRVLELPGAPAMRERVTLVSDKLVVYERIEGGVGLVMTGIETALDGRYVVRFTLTPAAGDDQRRVTATAVAADRERIAAGPSRLLEVLRTSVAEQA